LEITSIVSKAPKSAFIARLNLALLAMADEMGVESAELGYTGYSKAVVSVA